MVFEEQGEEEGNKVASIFPTKPSPQTDVREHLRKATEKQLHFNCLKNACLFLWLRRILVAACGLWLPDQSQTQSLCVGSTEPQPVDQQASPCILIFLGPFNSLFRASSQPGCEWGWSTEVVKTGSVPPGTASLSPSQQLQQGHLQRPSSHAASCQRSFPRLPGESGKGGRSVGKILSDLPTRSCGVFWHWQRWKPPLSQTGVFTIPGEIPHAPHHHSPLPQPRFKGFAVHL